MDRLVEVTDRAAWNELVDNAPGGFLTQLWEWGELQRSLGWEARRVLLVAEGAPLHETAAVQLLIRRIPGLGWGMAHGPRGPVGARSPEVFCRLVAALREWARAHKVSTIILDPPVTADSRLGRALLASPWREVSALSQTRCHIIDLSPGVDPWTNVRRKHREWIRRARRRGIEVVWTDADSTHLEADRAIGQFLEVYAGLANRIGIAMARPEYYRLLWDLFSNSGRAQLVVATESGATAAAMLHLTYGSEMLWFAGGQTDDGSATGAGKLLLWESIVRARTSGVLRYNLWGTATDGLAHYKEGFGAREERYVGTRAMTIVGPAESVTQAAWGCWRLARSARFAVARARRGG